MKKEVILPFTKPLITHAPMDTHVLAILGSQTEHTTDWILSNYINIRIDLDILSDTFCPQNLLFTCPFLESSEIHYSECLNKFKVFSNFCKSTIDSGNYIYPIINTKYIKQYGITDDFDHNPIIYGYNDDLQILYMAEFFAGIYTFTTVPYEAINASVVHLKDIPEYGENGKFLDSKPYCWIYKPLPHDEISFMFNREEIFEETRHFLCGTTSRPTDAECLYGVDCYDYVINERMSIRSLSLFYCVSYMWQIRIQFLYEKKLIPLHTLERVKPIISTSCEQSQLNKLLYLKCRQKQDNSYTAINKVKDGIRRNRKLLTEALQIIT